MVILLYLISPLQTELIKYTSFIIFPLLMGSQKCFIPPEGVALEWYMFTYQLTKEVLRTLKNSVKTKIRLNLHTHMQINYYNSPPMRSV